MEPTLSRRERKKLETRQALLEAAWTLFRARGFDDTTVQEITEQAGVAKGTFFNYFPSKDGLWGELALWRFSQLHEALDVDRGAPASPVARIGLLFRLLYEQMLDDWQVLQQAFAARFGNPHPAQHPTKRRLTGLLTELVKEAQACGEVRADVEAEVVSDLILVAHIRQLALCIHGQGAPPPVGHSERVIEMLMEGLAAPGWTRSQGAQ
ncbi:MAG: TetR/AcrR family transcriptional regulator [Anaerolineae bacterium]|jgi:NADH dehydrogenase